MGTALAGAPQANKPDWSGARAGTGTALAATSAAPHAPLLGDSGMPLPSSAPDLVVISLGFVANRSLAPPLG
jgi:hypothetical protein